MSEGRKRRSDDVSNDDEVCGRGRRKIFRFCPRDDVMLLEEVLALNPRGQSYGTTMKCWERVASKLQERGIAVQGRACQKRLSCLLDAFRSGSLVDLRGSRDSEDCIRRERLLEECAGREKSTHKRCREVRDCPSCNNPPAEAADHINKTTVPERADGDVPAFNNHAEDESGPNLGGSTAVHVDNAQQQQQQQQQQQRQQGNVGAPHATFALKHMLEDFLDAQRNVERQRAERDRETLECMSAQMRALQQQHEGRISVERSLSEQLAEILSTLKEILTLMQPS